MAEKKKREPFLVYITSDCLNLRTGPSKSFKVLEIIRDHGTYTVTKIAKGTGSESGWAYLSDKDGWVSLDYCERV